MTVAVEISALFAAAGGEAYFGEAVTVLEHGLQAAHFARSAQVDEPLVVAALLHDVGHLLVAAPEALDDWTYDAGHERVGASWLDVRFGAAVADPVRLHVAAKRYLCATTKRYRATLSPASLHTLELQGGPMSAAEAEAFRTEPHFRAALHLRLWDDRAKVPGLRCPQLDDYWPLIERLTLRA